MSVLGIMVTLILGMSLLITGFKINAKWLRILSAIPILIAVFHMGWLFLMFLDVAL